MTSKAQSLYTKQRFAKGLQRNITDYLKALITTDRRTRGFSVWTLNVTTGKQDVHWVLTDRWTSAKARLPAFTESENWWLNTVLRVVSGNSRDQIRQTNMVAKKAMVHRRRFLKIYSSKFCDIWQNFDFYRILNKENFKMKVEQTNFVIHLIITIQLYYWLSENLSVKIWSNKFKMVMINYSKLCASL